MGLSSSDSQRLYAMRKSAQTQEGQPPMNRRGLLVIISGPAGSGKSTIADEMIKRSKGEICRVVTATTRTPRPGEQDGRDYHFISVDKFKDGLENNAFLEYNIFNANYYGTPKAGVDDLLAGARTVLLVVDVNGAEAIKKDYPSCVSIFILPPSPAVLRERLSKRGTESKEDVEARLAIAEQEIGKLEAYDHLVINDDLDLAVLDAMTIIKVARTHHIRGGELAAWRDGRYNHWHHKKPADPLDE